MLKLKYLFENYDLAREALRHWAYDADTLDGYLGRFRISANAVYPFAQGGKTCFLRLAPVSEKREQNLLGELEFIRYLNAQGYPAAAPIPADNGADLIRLRTLWGDYFASAFQGAQGKRLDETPLSAEILAAYGRGLGRLHALSAAYLPETPKWSCKEALSWAEETLARYGAPDGLLKAAATLKGALGRLPQTPENYGLVHYDFEYDNVFYDEQAKNCPVIDFEDGMYHWYALDVEQALGALEEDADELGLGDFPAAEAAFLRGYRSERPYTEEMAAVRPLMRQFVGLYGCAKLMRASAEPVENEPQWMTELRGKLSGAIARKTELVLSYNKR